MLTVVAICVILSIVNGIGAGAGILIGQSGECNARGARAVIENGGVVCEELGE